MLFRESIHLYNTLTCEQKSTTKNIYLLQNAKGSVTKVGWAFGLLNEFAYLNEQSYNIAAEQKDQVKILPVLFLNKLN